MRLYEEARDKNRCFINAEIQRLSLPKVQQQRLILSLMDI